LHMQSLIFNIDLHHHSEENLFGLENQATQEKRKPRILFNNPFKTRQQKYDRIIESAFTATRKILSVLPLEQRDLLDSSLEYDKQLVYYVFEQLMANYYQKHFEGKTRILDFFSNFKKYSEEITRLSHEGKELKQKILKH